MRDSWLSHWLLGDEMPEVNYYEEVTERRNEGNIEGRDRVAMVLLE